MKKEHFKITPWHVEGHVNYEKLLKEFGTSKLDKHLIIPALLVRRGLYFSHRDFNLWLADAESGKRVSILTGRGPSERMHLGHIVPFLIARELQKKYKCNVYMPISEDEKFFVKKNLTFEQALEYASDNVLDLLALGFEEGKTFIARDFSYPPLYKNAAKIAKLITYSEAKAIFGLTSETNIGWTFYPAVQAVHILLPQFVEGPHRTLVPVGIDQDPFIRLTRDIASHSSLRFIKPSALHNKFLPSLKGAAKMSSSDSEENNVIYLSDTPQDVKTKINKYAFSGGKDTLEEHRKKGGNPDIDIPFLYLKYLFEESDKKLEKIENDYRKGKLLSGELKKIAIEKISAFLKEHQRKKQEAKKHVSKFMLKF